MENDVAERGLARPPRDFLKFRRIGIAESNSDKWQLRKNQGKEEEKKVNMPSQYRSESRAEEALAIG